MRATWKNGVGPHFFGLVLAACYSPSPPVGLACAPVGSPSRCPAGQECVVRAGAEVCALPGSGGDIDAAVIDAPEGDGPMIDAMIDASIDGPPIDAPPNWWNLTFTHRRPIDITAGGNGMPAGYSIEITLDHAALVAAGHSLASGEDVRIVRDIPAQADRVLDSGAAWNTATTKLWFPVTQALAPNTTVRYWVYYGNPTPGIAPANASLVFLFSDGFEAGLAAWSTDPGITTTTARAHRGTRSLVTPVTTNTDRGAWINAINEQNVAWDTWWNIDVTTNLDATSHVRGEADSIYLTNLQPPGPTWNIAKYVSGTYTELAPPPVSGAPPVPDTWFRVTFYAYQDRMAVDVNGTRYVPASGFSPVGTMTTGDVGISVYNATAGVYIDDAVARRFVAPEPVVVVGAQENFP